MKFANVLFDGNRTGSVNIGDDLQLVAIEHLYNCMGVDYKDVVRIKLSELSSYDGEYVILPISFPLYGYREGTNITMFSPKIIPVFLALSIMSGNISDDECDYLRHFEPIGCRDYHTVKLLRRKNILAYLNGCMSATFPRIRKREAKEKVYFVDVPEEYYDYVPKELQEKGVKCSQVLNECLNPEAAIKNRLKEYADNAALVVTTRLHCAMPCVAMGIPVVLMKDKYSFRFPFISRYIHVYEKEEFGNIDWNPGVIDYEDKKQKILDVAIKRIRNAYEKYSAMYDLSWFYEENNLREDYYIEHFDNVKEYIDEHFSKDESLEYAVWGITQKADMICSYLENNYKKSKLVYVYDKNKKIIFHGVESGNDLKELAADDVFVFVTTATANLPAIEFFAQCGKKAYNVSSDGISRIER